MIRDNRRLLLPVLLGSALLSGCTDIEYAMGKLPFLAYMRESVAFDPYEGGPRLAPEGSIPVRSPNGDRPAAFAQTELQTVAAGLTNPYPVDEAFLRRGELAYERNCTVCHGPQGGGDGPVVGPNKFPFAPAINGAVTAAHSDGYLYGVTRVGRGLMPAYGYRMTEADMWAVVAYVRRLQGTAEPVTDAPQHSGAPRAGPTLTDTLIAPSAAPSPDAASTDTAGAQPR
ncbi:MAG TPA: cytochrome c [Longimicrobiaceae bacterium]|nr:cytochrome c [Longimicrobiaceae bacterium]